MLRDLGIDVNMRLKTLSKGTKEKVQLVMVMSRNARLYMLDEPIGGVDPAARDYILNTIVANYNPNATVLITTHLINDVEKLLDEFFFIGYGGVILRSGSADEVRESEGKGARQRGQEGIQMFGKFLKYDFTHYLKLWTVGAATALIMAAVGGFCQSQSPWLYRTDRVFLGLMFTLITVVSVVSIIAFSLLSTVLVCMRYAKNCFSDEGYLTFTLPAKRSTIFNAKLTGGIIYYIMTLIITICAFAIFLGLAS